LDVHRQNIVRAQHLASIRESRFQYRGGLFEILSQVVTIAQVSVSIILDETPPTAVANLAGSTHVVGELSRNTVILANWDAATDQTSGLEGYSYLWSQDGGAVPDDSIDLIAATVSNASPILTDGDWYFNPMTTFAFGLSQAGPVCIRVYDIYGRSVRTLLDAVLPAGEHSVTWNGRDDDGLPLASGTFCYRVQAGNRTETRKMTLMK